MGTITVTNLGKAYKQYPSRWSRLSEWMAPFQGLRHKLKWVLQDINFHIEPGEAVGIIGINGAGKSTLLKMITGTTQPTSGSVQMAGRVAALLELGMGFHPDFTGRQNAFMAAQLTGLSASEITSLMPQIEAFAEIGEYIDQPVRVYSSGMQVRLAFSVATAARPDILIVDEALSVGDAYFQHKSFARIRQFRDEGTTILFVSHSPGAVKTLCNRALLLNGGCVARDGKPDHVLDYYNAVIAKQAANYSVQEVSQPGGGTMVRAGNRKAMVEKLELLEKGRSVRAISSGSPATLRVGVVVNENIPELTIGFIIRDRLGNEVFGTNTYHLGLKIELLLADSRTSFDFEFPALFLGEGGYSISITLHTQDTHMENNYDWWDRALAFQVTPGDGPFGIGVCMLPVSCKRSFPSSPYSANQAGEL